MSTANIQDPFDVNFLTPEYFEREGGLTIGVGARNCLYTLRTEWNEQGAVHVGDGLPSEIVTRRYSMHVRNLGKDWAEVALRLPEILKEAGYSEGVQIYVPGHCAGRLDPNKTPDPKFIPTEVIPFGKYVGQTISEIKDKDPKYLFWLADGYHPSEEKARGRWMAYLRDALSIELKERAEARKVEVEKREQQMALNCVKFKPLIVVLEQSSRQQGDFCSSMAAKFGKGEPVESLSPNAVRIVQDIWCKTAGRRNSAAYAKAWEEFDGLFLQAPEVKNEAAIDSLSTLPAGALDGLEQRLAARTQTPSAPTQTSPTI